MLPFLVMQSGLSERPSNSVADHSARFTHHTCGDLVRCLIMRYMCKCCSFKAFNVWSGMHFFCKVTIMPHFSMMAAGFHLTVRVQTHNPGHCSSMHARTSNSVHTSCCHDSKRAFFVVFDDLITAWKSSAVLKPDVQSVCSDVKSKEWEFSENLMVSITPETCQSDSQLVLGLWGNVFIETNRLCLLIGCNSPDCAIWIKHACIIGSCWANAWRMRSVHAWYEQ